MELKNPLYSNIGAHVINSIFSIDKGVIKVLLIKRTNHPYTGMWALVSGAMYNNELIVDAAKRELMEKTDIKNIELILSGIYDDVDRSPLLRMIGFGFIGLVDIDKVKFLKSSSKTSDANWFPIDEIPQLAYDHNVILKDAIEKLKKKIVTTDILKILYPKGFTIPEIHKVYESILNTKIDRRNLRKKLLTSGIIEDSNQTINFEGKKPAKIYKFNNKEENKSLF